MECSLGDIMIRMFIGTSANGEDAEMEMIYEYTLRKNCPEDLDIVWMRQTNDADSFWGGWDTELWPTPFSGYRWAIPEYCNFEGRAIYTDVDMINFKNIKELWDTDIQGAMCAARRGKRFGGHEFCVMIIDCKEFKDHVMPVSRMKNIGESHHRYIRAFSGNDEAVFDLDNRWNCLDGEDLQIQDMWQLHYTKMSTQPWKPKWFTGTHEEHPRKDVVDLWYKLRDECYTQGLKPTEVNNEVKYNIIGK